MSADHYTPIAYEITRDITNYYSTSFGMSSRLFNRSIRPHIYAIYGLVRLADEIVDSYRGSSAAEELDPLEQATLQALGAGYSANPIVHAFAQTARQHDITGELITPFFDSMRRDLSEVRFTQQEYERYIYGSAEVVGLMCLKVFTTGNSTLYRQLVPGAKALGAAYQKVNFLRDVANDTKVLGRYYFPEVQHDTLSEASKAAIIADITADFQKARAFLDAIPASARRAVKTSYLLYDKLLKKLARTPADTLMHRRIRINGLTKYWLFIRGYLSA